MYLYYPKEERLFLLLFPSIAVTDSKFVDRLSQILIPNTIDDFDESCMVTNGNDYDNHLEYSAYPTAGNVDFPFTNRLDMVRTNWIMANTAIELLFRIVILEIFDEIIYYFSSCSPILRSEILIYSI